MFSLYTFAPSMKGFLKYIFFFLVSLLIGNAVFAYSTKDDTSLLNIDQTTPSGVKFSEFSLRTHYKHYVSTLESSRDVIEISENENDTEDYHVPSQSFASPVYYLNFFSGILSGNYDIVKKNRLSSFKFMSYLSTIDSLHIIFCVYRI